MIRHADPNVDSRHGCCQCGLIQFQVSAMPLTYYACHCTDCRAQSASAFGLSYLIRPADFLLVSGKLKTHSHSMAETTQKVMAFCEVCGTRIYHGTADPDELISIKAGTLVGLQDLTPVAHIWTDSALPWVALSASGGICFNKQPAEEELIRLWATQHA